MAWRIDLNATAAKQLSKLNKAEARRITTFLQQRLAPLEDLRSAGKSLTGPTLGTYWRYRVGDYRLSCDIQDGTLVILVIVIEVGNRREVYR